MTTFLATATKRPNAVNHHKLTLLLRGTRYSVSYGDPARNQPALTLCFDGPRDQADQAMIDKFREICGNA